VLNVCQTVLNVCQIVSNECQTVLNVCQAGLKASSGTGCATSDHIRSICSFNLVKRSTFLGPRTYLAFLLGRPRTTAEEEGMG
jgi:hypothetical protein